MTYPNTFLFWSSQEGLTLVSAWARHGLGEAELARRMGVGTRTLRKWMRKSPALESAAIRNGEWADAAVEQALLRRAMGFTVIEKSEEETATGVKAKSSEKYIPPDLSAQLAWLRARCPRRWGEKGADGDSGVVREIIEAVKTLE